MKGEVSLERFRAVLAAYGARPESWPAAEREALLSFCDASAEARASFEAEALFELEFAAVPEPELAPDFLRRLNEVPLRAPQKRAFWSLRGLWVPAVSWAFAAVVGLGFGLTTEPLDDAADTTPSIAVMDSAAPSAAASTGTAATVADDDFSALAFGALTELEE